ncbi:MAG: bifunctional DNA-formamidopyrimidine glycosylase/DNA-(apurinic or apyrimidinic site) lyase [Gemmatimonadota bacterium]|nr:bifunctional DNA-formamidopyrimidine glycosylase/DNA-(apurinic or apyrimidinic site) lyase [Gemmatimonadota bacterium]
MPELPEVETVVRQLAPFLMGRKVEGLEIFDPKLDVPEKALVAGRTVSGISRQGKQVVIRLIAGGRGRNSDHSLWLCFHLRMTGRLVIEGRQTGRLKGVKKHLRARLVLEAGDSLGFYDLRRFGCLNLYRSLDQARPRGLDPLSRFFTARRLGELIACSRQEIKPWLLRQDRLTGIGNIYASEILFAARIDPRRPAGLLTGEQIRCLHRSVRKVLRLAIEHCGTTFSDFQDTRGNSGSFQHLLAVYARQGQPCPRCGQPIVRIVQQQRSTFFSPGCQK